MASFGERLRELRRQRNLKQSDVAQVIAVTERTIRSYEQGEREPSISQSRELAKFFGVDLAYLSGDSDEGQKRGVLAPEEAEFLKWVEDNLEGSFFYDFDKSPEDAKKHMMETLRLVWERERGRKPGQKQGE